MAYRTPGDIIHYRASDSNLSLWPAVLCTDDIAPLGFLKTRPPGYVTLVLRLGDSLDFCWASSTEMYDYNPLVPFEDTDMVMSTPGLAEAYAIANSALVAGLGLQHWRDEVRHDVITISSDESYEEDDDRLEAKSDQDLQNAIERSLEHDNKELEKSSTPQPPLLRREEPEPDGKDKTVVPGPFAVGARASIQPGIQSPVVSKHIASPLRLFTDKGKSWKRFNTKENDASSLVQAANDSSEAVSSSVTTDLLSWSRFEKAFNPVSDIIEEDLSASEEYIQVRVGASGEKRLLYKYHVWNRPYFREPRMGIMFFDLNDDGMWELVHPALPDIEPEDFSFAAEYLESGAFGNRHPQNDDEMDEAFIQVGSAWAAAEQLGMTDLMDHIVNKLKCLQPWDAINVLALACHVYASSEPYLPAQESLMEMLTTHIAEHYWTYIEDSHLSIVFIQRLKDCPQLERDICIRRAQALDEDEKRDNSSGDAVSVDMDIDL